MPPLDYLDKIDEEDLNGLLVALESPAADALSQMPSGSFDEVCALAVQLNIWQASIILEGGVSCELREGDLKSVCQL